MADVQDVHCLSTPILFVLPPCSSKLNWHVERDQRTHTEDANGNAIIIEFRAMEIALAKVEKGQEFEL